MLDLKVDAKVSATTAVAAAAAAAAADEVEVEVEVEVTSRSIAKPAQFVAVAAALAAHLGGISLQAPAQTPHSGPGPASRPFAATQLAIRLSAYAAG